MLLLLKGGASVVWRSKVTHPLDPSRVTQFLPCGIKYLTMEASAARCQYSEQHSESRLEENTC